MRVRKITMTNLLKAAEAMIADLERRAELELHAPDYRGSGVPEVACGNGVYLRLKEAIADANTETEETLP